MFGVPPTPETETGSNTWPKYISPNGTPIHQAFPPRLDKDLFTQPAISADRIGSKVSVSPSSPIDPPQLRTPIVLTHAQRSSAPPPSVDYTSPRQMPTYSDSPSPVATYGIHGGLLVTEPSMMHSANSSSAECHPLLPSQTDVFVSTPSKGHRPVLRPSFSHNAVLASPTPANWPRRLMTAGTADDDLGSRVQRARPTTTGTVLNTSVQPFAPLKMPSTGANPASAGNLEIPAHLNPLTTSAHPTYHHQGSAHIAPYSDELSFHTASYTGSYDSSYSNSPWGADSQNRALPYYPFGNMSSQTYRNGDKLDEPILLPGEMPAPRPPMSYAALIGEAILLAPPPHSLYVSEISDSVKRRYDYYRQNPNKIYNGVRHQTSMCKAFVKLDRPQNDQSGGARKWAIRAGCESWFTGGGYNPPGSHPPSKTQAKGGKAKKTAQAKQLVIGTGSTSPVERKVLPSYSNGPSSGPAFDGTSRPMAYGQPYQSFLPPGYHYVPVPASQSHPHPHPHPRPHPHPQPSQGMYVPVWGPYPGQAHPGPQFAYPRQHVYNDDQGYSSSPEQWHPQQQQQYQTGDHRFDAQGSEHGSPGSRHNPEQRVERSPTVIQSRRIVPHGTSPNGR